MSDAFDEVIVKLVPALMVYDKNPAFVVPTPCKNTFVLAVTEVFDTVTVPPTNVSCPILAFVPAFIIRPLPAVAICTFWLVCIVSVALEKVAAPENATAPDVVIG